MFRPTEDDDDPYVQPSGVEEPPILDAKPVAMSDEQRRYLALTQYRFEGKLTLFGDGVLSPAGQMKVDAAKEVRAALAEAFGLADMTHIDLVNVTRVKLSKTDSERVVKEITQEGMRRRRRRLLGSDPAAANAQKYGIGEYGTIVQFRGHVAGDESLAGVVRQGAITRADPTVLWRDLLAGPFTAFDFGPFIKLSAIKFLDAKTGHVLSTEHVKAAMKRADAKRMSQHVSINHSNATLPAGMSVFNASAVSDFVKKFRARSAGRKVKRVVQAEHGAGKDPDAPFKGPVEVLVSDFGKCVTEDPHGAYLLGEQWARPADIVKHEDAHEARKRAREAAREIGKGDHGARKSLAHAAHTIASVSVNELNGVKSKIMVDQIEGKITEQAANATKKMAHKAKESTEGLTHMTTGS